MASLEALLQPERCALLTMELQRGIVGDLSSLPPLRKSVAESGLLARTGELARAARLAGVRVIHCTAAFRRDRAGSFRNVPMVNALLRNPDHLVVGSPEVELVPELGPEPEDLVSQRMHGMSPFTHTSLEAMLRSEAATTVIATGVSLNVGILGLTIEALNRGFDVVIPRDCVTGFPAEYGEAVLEHTLEKLATLTQAARISALWADVPQLPARS